VTVRSSRCDDKHVGDNDQLRNVEQHNIKALFVIDRGGRSESGFDGFRCRGNSSVPSLERY
jgi:hypothetical protein